MKKDKPFNQPVLSISDDDVMLAMKDIPGYLDVTPGDLKEIFRYAYRHAFDRIRRSVRASDIMSTKVIFAREDTPLAGVAELMAASGVSGIPVLDEDGKVAGMISEKDFLHHMAGEKTSRFMSIITICMNTKGCTVSPLRNKTAADIMNSPAVTVSEETTAFEIAELFNSKGINRVPVIDSSGRLAGIVSRTDLIKAQVIRHA